MPYGTAVLFDRMLSNNPMEAWTAYSEEVQKNTGKMAFNLPAMGQEELTQSVEESIAAMEEAAQSVLKSSSSYNETTLENVREFVEQTREAVKTVLEARDFQALKDIQEDYAEFLFESVIRQSVLNYQTANQMVADVWTPWNTLMRKSMKSMFPNLNA